MRGIQTKKIKLTGLPPSATLAAVFRRVKEVLKQDNKIPIRMISLDHNKGCTNLLVSFIYESEKK
jgi:hypothetical protein